MLFSSLSFIFRFMPLFLIIYLLCPARGKNLVLLTGSLVFYALGEPVYVFLMLMSIAVNYALARFMAANETDLIRKKTALILAIIYNVGLLLFFKYSAFFLRIYADICAAAGNTDVTVPSFTLSLPLGISFYTFQIISYVVDVYNDSSNLETSFIDLGAYLAMFPQLIAGPIVVHRNIREHLKSPETRVRLVAFDEGLRIFTIGLGSKVLIANRLGQLWDAMDEIGYSMISTDVAWLGIIAYTLQIYFDFNGYSLMAVGLGRMLGFDFPQNFNYPYNAHSVTDFWKRWHITLTSFFREYIYIPLGGNRGGLVKTLRNMLIIWLITGFWHGADWNFIIWGLYYFVFLALERILTGKGGLLAENNLYKKITTDKKYSMYVNIISRLYALLVVITGWAIFAITDLTALSIYLGRMFAPFVGGQVSGMGREVITPVMLIWVLGGAVLSTPVFERMYLKIKNRISGAVLLFVIFWASIIQLVDSTYNPFLYFRF